MMFGDYQQKEMSRQIPFDVIIFSDQPQDTFSQELEVINHSTEVSDYHIYNIYENGTTAVNDYLYEHVDATWRGKEFSDGKRESSSYFGFDTYIGVSDYNRIRAMLGLDIVTLLQGGYILHGKEKIADQMAAIKDTINIYAGSQQLKCQTINMEPLSQNGINGADYLIVVADDMVAEMTPYYSMKHEDNVYDIEYGTGSNNVISVQGEVMVAENLIAEGGFVIVSLCFVLGYVGIIFLCAALTILAVQQLSDSAKYRFRYRILKQLGMSAKETQQVVLKQLAVYYLCPYLISIILSMFIGMFASERFVYHTGIHAAIFQYYILAVLVFTIIYLAYFAISYIGFLRNLEGHQIQ